MNKRLVLIGVVVFLTVTFLFFYFNSKEKHPNELSLKEAAKVGEVITHKLLVQIGQSSGDGRYERGDVVLTASSTKEFSVAEKEGFLIMKMDLTPAQAIVLIGSLDKYSNKLFSKSEPIKEILKRRKYAVDLEKIGISDNDFMGRELEEIYKWDILYEK